MVDGGVHENKYEDSVENVTFSFDWSDAKERRFRTECNIISLYVIPAICLFGAAGNLLNMLILIRPGQ